MSIFTGFYCQCRVGWSGRTCHQDIDECNLNLCPSSSSCVNQLGGFKCVWQNGRSLTVAPRKFNLLHLLGSKLQRNLNDSSTNTGDNKPDTIRVVIQKGNNLNDFPALFKEISNVMKRCTCTEDQLSVHPWIIDFYTSYSGEDVVFSFGITCGEVYVLQPVAQECLLKANSEELSRLIHSM